MKNLCCMLLAASAATMMMPSALATRVLADDHAQAASSPREILERTAPALVTIKYILKGDDSGGPFGGGDQEMEITGVMIDPAGVVLASNTEMGGFVSRFMGMGGGSPQPTEIKVLVGDDTQGVDAKIIARDSELDLAWVKVEKAPESPYVSIDLSASATAGVGDRVVSISRMSKFFDRAAMVTEFMIAGTTTKPRDLMFGGGGGMMGGGLGLPIFNAEGKLVGVTSLIMPSQEEMEGMAGGGMFGQMRDMMAGAILPAKVVAEATAKAMENAEQAPAAGNDAEEKAAEPE